jgi:hypothetical protein
MPKNQLRTEILSLPISDGPVENVINKNNI